MTKQHTRFRNLKSIRGPALLALGPFLLFWRLDGAACQVSHIFCAIAREAVGVLPSVVLAALEASLVHAFDHFRVLECLLQTLVSCWPLLVLVGAL